MDYSSVKTRDPPQDGVSDRLIKEDPSRQTTTLLKDEGARLPKRLGSADAILQFVLDISLTVPAVCFLTYGFMVLCNNGVPVNQNPVPALHMAAKYSPTLFPIAFSAIATNLLKATAAWRLEKGITILSLEYLLKCRNVFSAVTAPLSLQAVNLITPLLIVLWALSPLGGQAALRVMDTVPSTAAESWPFEYLEFMSPFRHSGAGSSAGYVVMPSIQAAFAAALSSPMDAKTKSQDLFGNIKIPMVEHYQQSSQASDLDGWYEVNTGPNTSPIWSSLIGLPATSLDGFSPGSNYSFKMETSYMSANCSTQHKLMSFNEWGQYRDSSIFHNKRNLALQYWVFPLAWATEPFPLIFTSWSMAQTTNATCILSQVYAEVDVGCHGTVLHQATAEGYPYRGPAGVFFAYFETFVPSGLSLYDLQERQIKPFASAIETYFTDPSAPFSAPGISSWNGTDMSSIGDVVFSQRFSQLLNTFWLASVASRNVTGAFNFHDEFDDGTYRIITQKATGTRTPDLLVMRVNGAWLSVLFVASVTMLAAGISAAILGCLRRGPDVLDYSTFFFRDSPYVHMPPGKYRSMEDASDQVRRIRDIRVCIGDVDHTGNVGRLAFGSVDAAVPLRAQKAERYYV
ncbi:hypothetical protein CH35J_009822 [Colletotrichum higginsianum]|uniref:Uncharacterized protein n=1 Tax=Colletotrichum higginsianum TaxID=80884 RepID=A0A4V4NB08_9PEZI|nr:hypothetical protein CH35J_009822 [Colletotrichum higginsianum]